jgi:hypothetical protein
MRRSDNGIRGESEHPVTALVAFMNRPEQELQRAVVQLLTYAAVPGLIWYAVPNGGWRSKIEAAIFAGLGVKPGVADIALVLPGGRAAFLELKSATGMNFVRLAWLPAHCMARLAPSTRLSRCCGHGCGADRR